MPTKVVQTEYPLIDADPHASRVVRYFRPSDYAFWAGTTAAFPAALYGLGKWCPSAAMLSDVLFRDGRSHWSKNAGAIEVRGLLGFHRWFPYGLPEVEQCVYIIAIASSVC